MSGTVHGKIDCVLTTTSSPQVARDIFATFVLFFDTWFTRIASHAGSTGLTGAAATALPGYTGSANFTGENAWGVWRWDKPDGSKVYIHLTWAWANNFNTGAAIPTAGGTVTFGVGIAFAQRTDNGVAWNGSTNNNGADTKNATVWTAGGGGAILCVYPRPNGVQGANVTALSAVANIISTAATTGSRLHIVKDDDHLWWGIDIGGNGDFDCFGMFARFIPHANLTPTHPLMCHAMFSCVGQGSTDPLVNAYGSSVSSVTDGGAVLQSADGTRAFSVHCVAALNTVSRQPNGMTSGYDLLDIYLCFNDSATPTKFGLFGKFDPSRLALVTIAPVNSTDATKARALFGSGTQVHYRWLVPWDGSTTPGSGNTLAGTNF